MNRNKLFEIVLIYLAMAILFSGCAAYQPTAYGVAPLQDGEVLNLYRGFSTWLATEGDAMVHTFYNANTGITVHTRAWMDGFAVACAKNDMCDDVVGYFVNIRTYKDFASWMTATGGFVEIARNLPSLPIPTIFVMPVMLPAGYQEGDTLHAWELMPCLGSICVEDEMGNKFYPDSWGVDPESEADGFADESETWEVTTIELP
jgi:hypothetical protein